MMGLTTSYVNMQWGTNLEFHHLIEQNTLLCYKQKALTTKMS